MLFGFIHSPLPGHCKLELTKPKHKVNVEVCHSDLKGASIPGGLVDLMLTATWLLVLHYRPWRDKMTEQVVCLLSS